MLTAGTKPGDWRYRERLLLTERFKKIVDDMVDEGFASYSCSLLTPDEASYFNYMFNDAAFSNALALRNRYDHASFSVADQDDDQYKQDYCRLLVLLIGITLKVSDELSFSLGKSGVEDFVDWPWVDETMVANASRMLDELEG